MINKQGRPKKEFTEDEKAEILDLYLNTKLSITEISSKFKVADYRVNALLKEFNIPKKKRNPPTKKETNIDISQIFKLRQQCYSSKEIAKKLNISDKFLRNICIQNNIDLNINLPKHINVQGKVEEIIEKFKNEISIFELAREYKVNYKLISKIIKYNNIPTHKGLTKKQAAKSKQFKHGLCSTPEWKIWKGIKIRCFNSKDPNYHNYGARGITMSKDWKEDFLNFYNYLKSTIGLFPGKPYSLDRINNDGNYEPGNIRWATPKQQCRNMRKTILTEEKVKLIRDTKKNGGSLRKLSKEFGIDYSYVKRIARGKHWEEIV